MYYTLLSNSIYLVITFALHLPKSIWKWVKSFALVLNLWCLKTNILPTVRLFRSTLVHIECYLCMRRIFIKLWYVYIGIHMSFWVVDIDLHKRIYEVIASCNYAFNILTWYMKYCLLYLNYLFFDICSMSFFNMQYYIYIYYYIVLCSIIYILYNMRHM